MDIPIIYEDDCFLAINKPARLVVNRSETQKNSFTVQDWVEHAYPDIFPETEKDTVTKDDFLSRSGTVHRIDKETSGVLLIAKTEEAFSNLQSQFKNREVHKKYLAWVYGEFVDGKIGEEVIVDAPIARNPRRREKFAVVEEGKPALTTFTLLKVITTESGNRLSLVECLPETGRTHQIRVHLTALGHPVIGDKLYSGKKRIRKNKDIYERQYLHASEIELSSPCTGDKIKIIAPVPTDMETVVDF